MEDARVIQHKRLVADPAWPEAIIRLVNEADDFDTRDDEIDVIMTWVTDKWEGAPENGGPYTIRTRNSLDKGASLTEIFGVIGMMIQVAIDGKARPVVDPSVLALLAAT